MSKSEPPNDSGSLEHSAPTASLSDKLFPPEGQPYPRWLTIAVCLLLAAVVWIVFGQTRHFQFINYDDPAYVYKNPAITQGLNWRGILWVFTHDNGLGEWFPLTDISHMLDWQLFGSNSGGHHLTNVLLHAATAIFLFLVLRKLTGAFWPAAFVAAVFAIHPLRVESVAWVVERKDVLSGLFFMLTLLCYAKAVTNHQWQLAQTETAPAPINARVTGRPAEVLAKAGHTSPYYWLALVFFAMGLLSKTMLVTLPFVLLLLDYWPLGRVMNHKQPAGKLSTFGFLILEKIPFLLLSAAACVATILTQKNAILVAQNLTFLGRASNAVLAYADYLGHMIYPVGLAVAYPHPGINLSLGRVGLAALILFTVSAGVIAGWRKHPWLLVGWLWYLGMFLPVIDIMQAGQNARADRYTYLPQIGLYILMTWGALEFCASWRHRRAGLGFAAVAILAGLLVDAHVQTSYWKDSVSLWTRTLACTSENSFAENNLGSALANQGKWDQGIQHFERAIQLKPDYAEARLNLGIALAAQGKKAEAIAQFERVLQLNPHSAKAQYNLGGVLADQEKWDEAILHFEQALRLEPDYAEARYDLGLALARQGKWDEAVQHFERALHLKLDHTDAQYILGVQLAGHQKWDEAIACYEQVLQVKPNFAEARNNLGVALAARGKSAEAIQQFQQALALATAQGNAALADSIRFRLKSSPPALSQPQTP